MATIPAVARRRHLRRADLRHTPDDGARYELIDGELYVSAAPGHVHHRATGRLFATLTTAAPAEFEVLVGPFAVALAQDTEIQPDIIVGRRKDFTEREIVAPALVVEVLSISTRSVDLVVKRRRLERAGVPSYWVVDPVARPEEASLLVWELGADGVYQEPVRVVGEQPYVAVAPFPVTVVPGQLVR